MAGSLSAQTPSVVNSLAAFGDNMQTISKRFENNVAVMALKAGVVVVESAAIRTPVDTSTARSNWQLDSVKPRMVRPPFTSGRHQGIHERSAYGSVVSAAQRSARSISRLTIMRGGKIWIVNPTPYIGILNAGSSDQNPEGDFDIIACQLAQGFIAGYARSGKLLTMVDSV